MKKAALLFVIVVVFGIGCFVGHRYHAQERYDNAYAVGEGHGRTSQAAFDQNQSELKLTQHHYEFKQHGTSIFRLDLDTGEGCYMLISKEDYEGTSAAKAMTWCSQ
jgi:hypothetical protein